MTRSKRDGRRSGIPRFLSRAFSWLLYTVVTRLELPLVFLLGVGGALYCFATGRSAVALLLLIIAALAVLIWATVTQPPRVSP